MHARVVLYIHTWGRKVVLFRKVSSVQGVSLSILVPSVFFGACQPFEWALPVCVYTQEVVGLEGKSGKSFVTPLIWVYIVPYNICTYIRSYIHTHTYT